MVATSSAAAPAAAMSIFRFRIDECLLVLPSGRSAPSGYWAREWVLVLPSGRSAPSGYWAREWVLLIYRQRMDCRQDDHRSDRERSVRVKSAARRAVAQTADDRRG